ncbi:TPA: morphogenetic protein [Klebsiella pneumoniae]|uniref:morphogenetic protein n=1 Tax=Klebsiella pneumoniae TaxID=573 RepID=UPI0015E79856|nr:morphogenetic protein [Klebsiella pneumoniae]MBA1590164.1 morphogenetic protein [Klebsiella pneumoniae]
MTERGMIFNAEMVRALLDGRKTQTRRPVKFPVHDKNLGCELAGNELAGELSAGNYLNSAFGKPGDRIWVRETWNKYGGLLTYRADHDWIDDMRKETVCTAKWVPSIHMPRWASRILLEITDVRVERLNAISEEDATAEGVPPAGSLLPDYPGTFLTPKGDFATAKVAFQRLWESIYGEESWKANGWVWVISFKRVEGGAA